MKKLFIVSILLIMLFTSSVSASSGTVAEPDSLAEPIVDFLEIMPTEEEFEEFVQQSGDPEYTSLNFKYEVLESDKTVYTYEFEGEKHKVIEILNKETNEVESQFYIWYEETGEYELDTATKFGFQSEGVLTLEDEITGEKEIFDTNGEVFWEESDDNASLSNTDSNTEQPARRTPTSLEPSLSGPGDTFGINSFPADSDSSWRLNGIKRGDNVTGRRSLAFLISLISSIVMTPAASFAVGVFAEDIVNRNIQHIWWTRTTFRRDYSTHRRITTVFYTNSSRSKRIRTITSRCWGLPRQPLFGGCTPTTVRH